jgi:N-acetyl-anhydromuramyl-L-alanine amidase AmpD
MEGLRDYTRSDKFWELIKQEAPEASKTFQAHWKQSEISRLTSKEACECLNALFIDTHARILDLLGNSAKKSYPTTKRTLNRLANKESVWWVDHFTAGISHKSTLNWFSAASAGRASTHFILGYHGDPFYIIPLVNGAWHAPARNADSWSIEMVNCGPVVLKDGKWYRITGAGKSEELKELPTNLVKELPPQAVSPAYKGASYYQPFTSDQVTANIKLKRIIRWATGDKYLAPERMSQHSQWQEGKKDMGPLWPFEEVNEAAFFDFPLDDLSAYHQALVSTLVLTPTNPIIEEHEEDAEKNSEYGVSEDPEKENKNNTLCTVQELQKLLSQHGYAVTEDGIYGPATKRAVIRFQREWSDLHVTDTLLVDGIPGPQTLRRLKENG